MERRVQLERDLVIRNREGLHFRPIMQVVDAIAGLRARVTFQCEDRVASGHSPMELLTLVATQGSRLKVVAEGDQAADALDAVAALIESGFGEVTGTPGEA